MSAEDFEEDTSQEYFDRDGVTWVRQLMNNILLFGPELGAWEKLHVGENNDWSWLFDSATGDRSLEDANGDPVTELPASRREFGFERLPLVPEYDAVADVPDPDPDGPYSSEPAYPRGIVRFTQTAAGSESALDAAGLYSYSIAEGAWMRLDVPPP